VTQLAWSAAIRIAWREMRASRAKFLFVILSVAIGVGSLTGVRSFSRSFRHMLLSEARNLMAGDMTVRVFAMPGAEQSAVLDALAARGVRRTWITETVTMAASASTPDPLLISVKAVDPGVYPFYGAVKLDPPRPLREALDAHSVAVSDDLLLRLNVHTGDSLRIGGQDFRIAGVVRSEPDRMTGSLNVGPRVMITREGLERTGLISIGSRAAERYLFSLPAGGTPGVTEVRAILKQAFPESVIADYTETHPIITRGLDRATTFLSLIALIALVIGAMGVASAMHGHLQQKMDSIAVMKCIGARSAQVIRIYTAQTLMLGLGGGLIGVTFGVGVAAAFPGLIAKYIKLEVGSFWDPWPALQGIAVACLVTLLFTLPPLLSIREIRPALIFRRDVDAGGRKGRRGPAFLTRAAILLGTGAVAGALNEGGWRDALRTGSLFTAGVAVGIGLLWLAGWLALRGFRGLMRRAGGRMSATRGGAAHQRADRRVPAGTRLPHANDQADPEPGRGVGQARRRRLRVEGLAGFGAKPQTRPASRRS
jgi:putative ABC transport system permease protein